MDESLDIFTKLGKSDIDEESFVSFYLRLDKPIRLEYTIKNFLDEKKHTKPELFDKKLKLPPFRLFILKK